MDVKSRSENIPHLYYCFLTDLDGVGKAISSESDEGKMLKGRMLVDLSREYPRRMEFEVEGSREDSEVVSKPFIKKNMMVQSQVDYFAEVVEELTPRNLSFIQLIDNSFFATANVFQEEQSLTLIQSKIEEAKQYERSAIIIDFDSIIKLNKSINKDTTSLSIDRPNLYRELLNIAIKLPKHNAKKELWVVLIVSDQDLVKLIKRDIAWPLSAEEKMDRFQ